MSDNRRLLSEINLPADIKKLSVSELEQLCKEIREEIVRTISNNGGHLASSLGVVELTVAINRVFNRPKDKVVWDVGHQCYADKIITGRLDKLSTIRKPQGLSGFPKPNESEYDAFCVGHSSTSISVALGIARANYIKNSDSKTVAIIGDGALSGGLAFEGLNNVGRYKNNLIIILNDNKMSISRNVGSLARHLAITRTSSSYLKAKKSTSDLLEKVPVLGKPIEDMLTASKTKIKKLVYKNTIFDELGFTYYGPIDGHNIEKLCRTLQVACSCKRPVIVHIATKKGKGYLYAERNPSAFHGISSFDIKTGKTYAHKKNFSYVFGETLCHLAEKNDKICAITAAMATGTGLKKFAEQYKDRFFDVGIAEEHAVTFSSGLAVAGLVPVFAVYSTFLQRSYDQLIHDVALQDTKVILAIDRAGVVGEDGETHQGLFDVSMLNSVPNAKVYSPSYFCELERDLSKIVHSDEKCLTAVRYPRGGEWHKPSYYKMSNDDYDEYFDGDIAVVTYGRLFSNVCKAYGNLNEKGMNQNLKIIKLNKIKPLNLDFIGTLLKCKKVIFFEEGMLSGGVAQAVCSKLLKKDFDGDYRIFAVEDHFVKQNTTEGALEELGLDVQSIEDKIAEVCSQCQKKKKD